VDKTREQYRQEAVLAAASDICDTFDWHSFDPPRLSEILGRLWDDGADIGRHDG
jgi:hypothetical protein